MNARKPRIPRNPRVDSLKHLSIALGAISLTVGGLWVAVEGGFTPTEPPIRPQYFIRSAYLTIESLPTLFALVLGAAGLGWPIRRYLLAGVRYAKILQLACGLGAMLAVDWTLGLLGLLNGWSAWTICCAGVAILAWQIASTAGASFWRIESWPNPPWPLLLGLPLLGLYVAACAMPPGSMWLVEARGSDVLSFHLQLPKEWLDHRRIIGLHHNVYSYLPNLIEAGYMQVLTMRRASGLSVYTPQMFHALLAVLTAGLISCLVSQLAGRAAALITAVAFLALPWTVICGTLAYDQMGALALAAAALLILFDPVSRSWRGGLVIGLLLGGASLADLTVGAMVIPGVLVLLASRLNHAFSWRALPRRRGAWGVTAMAVVGIALALSPWLVRNKLWTGNPVFPFTTKTFGLAHWDQASAQRWQKTHAPTGLAHGITQLGPRWLWNTGYGAIAGRARTINPLDEQTDVARFDRENGFPVFWAAAFAGAAVLLTWRSGRKMAVAMLVLLAGNLAVWLLATQHEPRLLLPTLLPGAALIGLGAGRFEQLARLKAKPLFPLTVIAVLAALVIHSFLTYFAQTPRYPNGEHYKPWTLVDSLAPTGETNTWPLWPGDHPLNRLPDVPTYCIADARMLYVKAPVYYHTHIDRDPLGEMIRATHGDPKAVTALLIQSGVYSQFPNGFRQVWVDWSQLARLQASGEYDPDVTPDSIHRLAALTPWKPLFDYRPDNNPDAPPLATLYQLPLLLHPGETEPKP